MPYSSSLYDIGENIYIKEELSIKYETKNLPGILEWMKNHTPFLSQ